MGLNKQFSAEKLVCLDSTQPVERRVEDLVVEPGIFEVMIGSSSEDIRLKGSFKVR